MHIKRIVLSTALVPVTATAATGSFLIADRDDVTPPPAVTASVVGTAQPTRPEPVPQPIEPTPAEHAEAVPTITVDEPEPTPTMPPAPARAPERSFVDEPAGEPHPDLGAAACVDADPAEAMTHVFDGLLPLVGADYQRAFPLPDGRVLWLFQDAFVDTPKGRSLVHNAGLLQSGTCFQLLHGGSGDSPTPFLFADRTDRHTRWFWPLGGEIGADGQLHVFVAEMHEHSGDYLGHVEPVATWLVTVDPVTLDVVDERPAPNPHSDLYGWSVVSHGDHTFLYAHCYRQFGWDPFPGDESASGTHDWDCTADVTVARVPRGRLDATPEYWDGERWTPDGSTAAPVMPTEGRAVNPTQVAVLDDRFVAVTKVDDWWSHTVQLDVAPTPHGPWTTYHTLTLEPRCEWCTTYFASIVPFGESDTSFSIAVSNNHWDGDVLAHYRPSVLEVPAPT